MGCLTCLLVALSQGSMCDPDGKTMTCTHAFSGILVVVIIYTLYAVVTAKCPLPLPTAN
jgi:hypothetical protein